MPAVPKDKIRNVVLLSHGGAGKTLLTEALLYTAGAVTRIGTPENGNTTSDYEPEEIKRSNSVQATVLPLNWRDHKINLIDTPGYADYRGEVVSSARVADAAILVISGPAGVEVGSTQMWNMAVELDHPRIVFVSKLDRDNADFGRVVDSLEQAFGRHVVPVQVPIGSEADFSGVVSLLGDQSDVPDELSDDVEAAKDRLVEAIAETDDDLATKYLEGEPLTESELIEGLKKGVASGEIVPLLAGSSPSAIGASELLDAIVDFLPSAGESASEEAKGPEGGENVSLDGDPAGPLAALVFKTTADPFVGRLSLFRVYNGTLKSDSQLWNATAREAERVGQVFVTMGKEQHPVDELGPGDIGAAPKLSSVLTGHTLSTRDNPLVLEEITFPSPVYQMAVSPKSQADLDKLTGALSRIAEEDPSLKVTRSPETQELLLAGLGDNHVEVAVEKMARKFGVEIVLNMPKVPYRETINATTRVEYRHKKQSGGHGQFGHVWLEIGPQGRGDGFDFASTVVGGSVPREYIPAVEKGVVKAMDSGVVAGYPVVDLKAVLFDGSFHPVDSSGICFEIAGGQALSKGMKEAVPVLLEPVMRAKIVVPDEYAGDVMGDFNSRRGRIQGMTPKGDGTTEIEAEIPQAEMLRYATDLRSQTQGQGTFTTEFDHYDEVPGHLVPKIVEETERAKAEARS
jgi:elongation factor G